MQRLWLCLIVILHTAGHAAASGGLPEIVAAAVDGGRIAGAVVLVTDREQTVLHEAAGSADLESRRPMSPDSLFWIASMTKPITAAAVMILVDEGKVKLDEPVATYLPEFREPWVATEREPGRMVLRRPGRPITVRDLLAHTSGLPFKSPIEAPTLDLLPLAVVARGAAQLPLLCDPGDEYHYSNAGINTAGRIIEVVAGTSFEAFLQERLLTPLGMTDTTFRPTAAQLARLATSYRSDDKSGLVAVRIDQLSYPLDAPSRQPMPGGGLFSTAADCGRFCRMLLGGGAVGGRRILSEKAVREMRARQTPETAKEAYGLGLQLQADGRYGHGGALATDFTVDDARGVATVWLVQDADPKKPSNSCRKAVEEWLATRPWSAPAAGELGVLDLMRTKCFDCHSGDEVQGGVDLAAVTAAGDVAKDFRAWQKIRAVVETGRMPPREAEPLAVGEREVLCGWIAPRMRLAIEAHAGDPGLVTLRRLTNAEYDATLRDLTGLDFGLAREFDPDGGGGEGFSNTGDVLFVSPRQFDRYLSAARWLAEHASILPGTGIAFHPQRVGRRGPEQLRNQAQQAIYVWYQKAAAPHVPLDGDDLREADYLLACWKHHHRELTGATALDAVADAAGLSRSYLANWWAFLQADEPASRYLDLTRLAWRALPPPDAAAPHAVPESVITGTQAIQAERKSWYTMNPERWGETTQRAQQDVEALRAYPMLTAISGRPHVHVLVGDAADGNEGDVVRLFDFIVWVGDQQHGYFDWLVSRRQELEQAIAARPAGAEPDPAMARDRDAVRVVLERFGRHPRGRAADPREIVAVAPEKITLPLPAGATKFRGQGRLDLDDPDLPKATAQWMATTNDAVGPAGVYADALTVWPRHGAKAGKAMHEFHLMRQAFPATRDLRLDGITQNLHGPNKNHRVYWLSDEQLLGLLPEADRSRHAALMADWNTTRQPKPWPELLAEWDNRLLAHVEAFAARAWRGPLTDDERARLHGIYKKGLEAATAAGSEGGREQAAREAVVAILSAPRFLFRIEEQRAGEQRVSAHELATRVSYFLWSSLPDDQLRQAAVDGSLLHPERLTAEVRRMLADPKAEALAREFAAQWLRFRGFATKAPPDREKYPELSPELQADMEREAVAFLADMIRTDRPLRELFTAGHTFLNERLATHYAVPGVVGPEFRRVDVAAYGRGGLLGMAAVLASTSYPRRTSPVLRGNWVLSAVLGTPTPPPPPNIPPLDESPAVGVGLRARLQTHRATAACAVCHDRIDPLGFALEGFDALGRRRDLDDTGAPVDLVATLADGTTFTGFDGLRGYLARSRDAVTLQFCRKLLGYALGREILPTDLPLLEDLRSRILTEDAGISAAVLGIVQSRQFQNRRDDATPGT